jgi:hypothetical protein
MSLQRGGRPALRHTHERADEAGKVAEFDGSVPFGRERF